MDSSRHDNNIDYLDAPIWDDNPQNPANTQPKVQQINTGARLEQHRPLPYGQQSNLHEAAVYDPLEVPSSLQAILSNHHVKTNFLKTPPRTEHFGYQTEPASEYQPSGYRPSNMMAQAHPDREIVETVPSKYHEIAQRFYTSSGQSNTGSYPSGKRKTQVAFAEDAADDRYDSEDSQQVEDKVESKDSPMLNTAVIALKLSTKLLDLYKTVSPYLSQ